MYSRGGGMIKNLRKRFIFAAMASTFGVLLVIMSILNVANYYRMVSRADETLTELGDNNGRFDSGDFVKKKPDITTDDGLVNDIKAKDDMTQPPDNPGGKYGDRFSPETPFQTRYFSVVVENGEITSYNLDNIAAVDEEEANTYASEILKDGSNLGFTDIYRYKLVINDDGERIIFVDCRQELEAFRNTLIYSVGVSLIGFLVVFMLVLFWSKKIFKPVAESYEKQKRFITDASHEIKTPLTIIDANTEVIEMVSGESEWTRNTRDQVKRLTALTNQMVALSRLDENPEPREKAEFNLSDVAYEVIDHFTSLSEVKGKKINADIQNGIIYTGDENSIRQLISILVDNAMKYAVSSEAIDITLKRDGRKVRFTLRNLAEGMEEGDQRMLFERFYRPDSSRNSETGGSGIGLSLAKSIVESHKGKITAKCDRDGYITFQIVI
ncbi:MAG: HAMP domain-containing sensor histidine kinase [Clostridiales bacterium]|nr:HAMP domain-containing sensor histidine kinase [Clostridiales bacterium]